MVRVFITREEQQDFWIFVPECPHNLPFLQRLSFGSNWKDISNTDKVELQHITVCEVSILFGYGEEPEHNIALKYEKECIAYGHPKTT